MYKFSDLISAQVKEICYCNEDSNIVLTILGIARICGYGVLTLEDYG